jgi:hypothetical protein
MQRIDFESHSFCANIETSWSASVVDIPVISNHVLHGMPAFVRHEIGQKALLEANRAAGFDLELIEDRNCFVPYAAVVGFLNAAARAAGEPNLGILMAPVMNVANYGSFRRYVIGADTLGQSLERSIAALCYHSTGDRMSVTIAGEEVRYSYVFALAGCSGYDIIACAAAGELLSVFRAYLPVGWRPLRVELDIDKPRQPGLFEDVFQCPVLFNAPAVTIVIERHHLTAGPRRASQPIVTIRVRSRPASSSCRTRVPAARRGASRRSSLCRAPFAPSWPRGPPAPSGRTRYRPRSRR